MLKGTGLTAKGWSVFGECLSVVPSLKITARECLADPAGPDFRVVFQGDAFRQVAYLDIKALGTPKSVRESANMLIRWTQREPGTLGVIIAPYISPRSAAMCQDAGLGYIDFSGNCLIAFQQVFINRVNMVNRYPFKTGLASIYSPKSERILRVLLGYPYQPWKVIALAGESQVSLGMITHVSNRLAEEEWLKKTPEGVRLLQPEKLLEDWTNNYNLKQNLLYSFYTLKSLADLEQDVASACDGLNIPYALTGFSACRYLAPLVQGQRAMIYADGDMEILAEKAGLKPVESGANVLLVKPYDAGVFWNAKLVGKLMIADPVQVYLDIKKYPGRGEEAADFLFREVIQPKWQQQKANTTAF